MEIPVVSLAVMGPMAVGKSSLTIKYALDTYYEHYDSTLQDTYTKIDVIDGKDVKVLIHDTAGQQHYIAMRQYWMTNKDGLIFVYAIDSNNSFEQLKLFLEQFSKAKLKIPVFCLGNKLDKPRTVPQEEGLRLADQHGAIFYQVCAKTGLKVREVFQQLVSLCLKQEKESRGAQRKMDNSWCVIA